MKRLRLSNKRYLLRASLPILVLLLLPLVLFAPVTLGSRTLLPADNLFAFEPYSEAAGELGIEQPHNALLSDLLLQNYAWKRFIVQSIQAKQIPLWNPYLFGGAPFLANGQHSALYPLSAIFYVLPLCRAYGVFVALHLGLAGVFMFILARVLGVSRLGATVAGMAFQLSGFFVVSAVHPMIIASATWLPLILAAIELMVQQRPLWGRPATVPWALVGAAALGCSALAGHPEVLYFSLLVAAFYTVWRLLFQAMRCRQARPLLRPAGWILVMVVLGLGLGGIQLLPLTEVVSGSFREGTASLSQVRGWAYPARRVLTFLVPNFFGNPAHHDYVDVFSGQIVASPRPLDWGIKNYVEGGAYLGLLPLFLSALAVLHQFTRSPRGFLRHPYISLFLTLTLFSLACMFGTPLYALVYALPFLNQSHSPFRWVFPLTLSIALLSGFGTDVLRRTRQKPNSQLPNSLLPNSPLPYSLLPRSFFLHAAPSLVTFIASLAFWGGVLLLTGLLASRLLFNQLEPTITRVFHSLALADTAFTDARAFYSYEFRWALLAGLLLLGTGIVLRVSRCPIYLPRLWRAPRPELGTKAQSSPRLGRRPVWEALVLGLLALDLWTFGWGFNPAADPALLDYTPPLVEFLKQDEGLWRLTTFDPDGNHIFEANAAWLHDLQDARGYDSLFSAQYRDYMRQIDVQDGLEANRIAPLRHWSGLDSPLLDMLNVKYVLSRQPLDASPKYRLVYPGQPGEDTLRVYENLGAMPRAYLMSYACSTASDEPLAAMQKVDPRQTVIVRPQDLIETAPPPQGETCAPGPAWVSSYSANEVFVDVKVGELSWLVLTDSFFPGWKAFARQQGDNDGDETELEIAQVAGNFRGVALEQGAWTVRFKYSPNLVKIGAFVSFLSGVIGLFLTGAWLWRFFYRAEDDAATARRVAKNSLAPIVLNLMNRAVDMGFAALSARLLGPDGSGKYAYAVVIFGWCDIFVGWGMNTLLLREVARDKRQANRYLVNTTVLRVLLLWLGVPLLGLFVLGRNALSNTPLSSESVTAIALLFVGLAPATMSTGLTALFQAYEKHEIPAAITSISTLVKVTLGTLALMVGWGIVGLAGVSIVTNLITLTILLFLAARLFFRPRWENDWRLQRRMMVESFPLMLNHLLATLFFQVDIILLEAFRNRRNIPGDVIVGWYSWAYKGILTLNVIPSFFTFAIFPVMARQAREDRAALSATYHLAIKLLVVLALPAAMSMTLLARPFIAILGGDAFLPDSAIALQLMVWSIPIGWINSVTNYVLIAVDQQRFLTRAFVVGLVFNLVANAIFIYPYDYRAAAIVTIFSELVLLVSFYVGIRRHLAPVPWAGLLWRPVLAGAVMVAVGLALMPTSVPLALLASLSLYALGLLVLKPFTPDEIALALGRPRSRQ